MTDLDHRVRVSDTEPGYSAAIRRARSPQWVRSCHLGPLGHVEPNAEENDRQNRMKSSRWPQQRPDQSTADTQINEIERAESQIVTDRLKLYEGSSSANRQHRSAEAVWGKF